jgi:hypothetical protein
MGKLENLVLLAEDQLTEYSTDARKIEKLRQKIGLLVPMAEQTEIKQTLQAEMPTDPVSQMIEKQLLKKLMLPPMMLAFKSSSQLF